MTTLTLPDYLLIPSILIKDKNLQPLDREVYGLIYWITKLKNEKCTASNRTLGELLNATPMSISNSLARLKRGNYIKLEMTQDSHRSEIIPLISFNKTVSDTPISNDITHPSVDITPPLDNGTPPLNDVTYPPSNDGHNKKIKEEKIITNVIRDVAKKPPSCPLMTNLVLEEKYPLGHRECVEYILSIEEERKVKFINRPKQFKILHAILRAGFDFSDIDKAIPAIEKSYGKNSWDLATISNWMEKGAVRINAQKISHNYS